MVTISEYAKERWDSCMEFTQKKGDNSLQECFDNLSKWGNPITIFTDWDEMSFQFAEHLPNGVRGICGGIIYHGSRDGFGAGIAPTFSVTLDRAEGYRIHT